jgi:energy-coupling factor transport system ATP-binding protein
MTAVEARAVTFQYHGHSSPILNHISFSLPKGQIAALTGPSGCGKSTLGYCLCGVIPRLIQGIFEGEIKWSGRAGIVFQDPDTQLFLPTVEDELAFGPENLCLPRAEIGKRISSVLELLGLTEFRGENPMQLSGGQKQLVALGGVLTLAPDLIILDETLSQLDKAAQARVNTIISGLKQEGKTIIMIEHDKDNLYIADQLWLLDAGKLVPFSIGEAANE